MRFFSARAAARFVPVLAAALLLPGVVPMAAAAKVCTLGPPEQGLSTAEDSLADCLARLRRYDGEADAQGRVYALFGNVTLAVDSEGSYRYYPDGDTWAQFAGAPGWASALLRSIKPPREGGEAQAESQAPAAAPLQQPELTMSEALQPVPEAEPEAAVAEPAPAALPDVVPPASASSPAIAETAPEAEAPVEASEPAVASTPTPTLAIDTTIAPVVMPEPPAAAAAAPVSATEAATTRDGALVACQYQQDGSWRTSRHFDLQSCAAQVEAVFLSGGGQGVMNGYWNGTFISATSGGVYVSRDGGGSWERLPR